MNTHCNFHASVIALLLVLIIYPVSFSKELKTSKYN